MAHMRILSKDLRKKLKEPLGELLKGDGATVKSLLRRLIDNEKPCTLIAVGDETSNTLRSLHIKLSLYIFDGKIMRKTVKRRRYPTDRTLTIKNPPGTLSEDALNAVKEALKGKSSVSIEVDGEEDLMTLPAILYSPKGAIVLYGQPGEGVVAVRVTNDKIKLAKRLIEEMKVLKI